MSDDTQSTQLSETRDERRLEHVPESTWGRIRNFCWTQGNPSTRQKNFWKRLCTSDRERQKTGTKYVVFQTELGTGGLMHLQGYTEMVRARRLQTIRKIYGGADTLDETTIHIEARKGTQGQAIAYCQKQATRVNDATSGEGGTPKKLGKDKLSVVTANIIMDGLDVQTMATEYPVTFVKYGAKIGSWALSIRPKRDWKPDIIIMYGSTGTGKSTLAKEKWNDKSKYWVPIPESGGWWWFNYGGEWTIVLDDWKNQYCKFTRLLRLFDSTEMVVQAKGVQYNMCSHRIVITTTIDPLEWYPNMSWDSKKELRRRFRDFSVLYRFADNSTMQDRQYEIIPGPTWAAERQ